MVLRLDIDEGSSGDGEMMLLPIGFRWPVVSAIRTDRRSADILIGTHGQMTPAAAIRFARRVDQYDPLWLGRYRRDP